jgi:hypothetical protein
MEFLKEGKQMYAKACAPKDVEEQHEETVNEYCKGIQRMYTG